MTLPGLCLPLEFKQSDQALEEPETSFSLTSYFPALVPADENSHVSEEKQRMAGLTPLARVG